MKIELLYDGLEVYPEDGFLLDCPLLGVMDGISGVYYPGGRQKKPLDFNGKTGGQMAVHTLKRCLVDFPDDTDLVTRVDLASNILRDVNKENGVSLEEPEYLASVVFVIAKIKEEGRAELIQIGDCLAVWISKDGNIGATPNQCFSRDMELREKIAKLMQKHKGNRENMWREFGPLLIESRKRHVNRSYGILNGQERVKNFLNWFSLRNLQTLLLFSDGFINYPDSRNEVALARTMIEQYKKGGLEAILEATRKLEEKQKETSHTDKEEASAIAIEF